MRTGVLVSVSAWVCVAMTSKTQNRKYYQIPLEHSTKYFQAPCRSQQILKMHAYV